VSAHLDFATLTKFGKALKGDPEQSHLIRHTMKEIKRTGLA
jgi:hypothetical protein